ncbi:MAG TPA: site-specific integrase [Candidatus Dormibacteraeota bacterium]|nr:site-specific integrase [Candidatus Dormibacteraeota bacterium]
MAEGTTRAAQRKKPRPRRRDAGDGAVFQRGDGRWVARLKLPDGGGWRYFYGKDRAAAKARLSGALRAVEDGRLLPDQRQTFGAHLEQWVNAVPSASIKPSTCRYYTRYVRYHLLTSDLARKPLARLEAADLRQLYADKLASGLSSTSVHHLHATIHVALNQALDDGKVARNVAALVGRTNRPKVRSREMTTIADGDQPARFLDAAHGERLEALLVLAITTGMRQGELRALRWKDVDLDRRVLAVTGSVTGTARAAMTIGTPKSGKTRSVALGAVTVTALLEHRRRQVEEQLLIGSERKDQGLVFCTEFGEFLPTNTMVLLLHRVLARAGLPRIRFHDLRHTAATLMLANGVHPKIVSEMLGHSTTAITLDLYSHVSPHMQQTAAATIDDALLTHGLSSTGPTRTLDFGGNVD